MTGRGKTGTVKGIDADRVRELMLAFYDATRETSFRPREAAAYFVEEHGVDEEQADALTQTYLRVFGVEPAAEEGAWRAETAVRTLLEHRDWRIAAQIDLAGARWLVEAINVAERSLGGAPESVDTLRARCRQAVADLGL